MKKNKIDIKPMDFYKPSNSNLVITTGEICNKCKQPIIAKGKEIDILNKYLKDQSDLNNVIKLIVKEIYGGWSGLDRSLGKNNYSQRAFKRLVKKSNELYSLINLKPSLKE